ncbi:uncharacterized protein LODBEIA_P14220 [Lodderomyces beijingensis]|uniref:PPM-type phosphatase domain-containing protein n=1 Tax=Lodderomyces beijingensis TaxID=1775926 RepID=A0ABP0ZGB6_9ASCO
MSAVTEPIVGAPPTPPIQNEVPGNPSPGPDYVADEVSPPGQTMPPLSQQNLEHTQPPPPVPQPKADKNSVEYDPFAGLSFKVGVSENKNSTYRSKMEDVHTYIANYAERVDWGYFAIFDGHAGKDSARWCGNNLHTLLEEEIDFELRSQQPTPPPSHKSSDASLKAKEQSSASGARGRADDSLASASSTSTLSSSSSNLPLNGKFDLKEHLYRSFLKADELIEKNGQGASGCTAAVAVLRWESESEDDCMVNATNLKQQNAPSNGPTKKFDFVPSPNHKRMLYTANVGDSRLVLCRSGQPYRLSYDHKASDSNEIDRIENSGGLILKNRVNGILAVSRSLGDSYMKGLVLGKPFTTSTEILPEDEFMIIACDGLWDVLSDAKACKYVAQCFSKGLGVQETSKKLCQLAIDNSTTDNVTVMIIQFESEVFAKQN